MENNKTVPEMLREAADTYEERNKVYGDTYKKHGTVMQSLFPDGVSLDCDDDHNRFGVLTMIVGKLTRYAQNFNKGGHYDSLHDLSVYATMLNELDAELNRRESEANVQFTGTRYNDNPQRRVSDNED